MVFLLGRVQERERERERESYVDLVPHFAASSSASQEPVLVPSVDELAAARASIRRQGHHKPFVYRYNDGNAISNSGITSCSLAAQPGTCVT